MRKLEAQRNQSKVQSSKHMHVMHVTCVEDGPGLEPHLWQNRSREEECMTQVIAFKLLTDKPSYVED
jgi:hypothetical protein